jgi:ribose 5-phosphate isomerase B
LKENIENLAPGTNMKIAIGADHAGFAMKEAIEARLKASGHTVEDFGTHSPDAVDYPDVGAAVAKAVASQKADRGILVCSTGIGMSIVANKIEGVRAALCDSEEVARLSRSHNDANVLTLSGNFTPLNRAQNIVEAFLGTEFPAVKRHERRVAKIHQLTGL